MPLWQKGRRACCPVCRPPVFTRQGVLAGCDGSLRAAQGKLLVLPELGGSSS